MESEKEHIRHCLLYEFDKKSVAAVEYRNVSQVNGEVAIDESTCRRWFRYFKEGGRSSQDLANSGRPSNAGEVYIGQAIRNNSDTTVEELEEIFIVYRTTSRESWLSWV
ncbi:Histone-lysine N-methyltransferase SETMAR like protein [Argiope bruennichi]|uniref:Histone-lysine N-methyltransferase SETMAR like protein n=1 Tax=Argiope bruennichi TaxID=94029 RepID=A0A8T0FFV4_ARGBR|nr:Histone-lysine N-methyltransferase SETMAR like protein [Argiope bruennichi]